MNKLIIKNAVLVNESRTWESDLLISGQRIERIDRNISDNNADIFDANGLYLIPGAIDDQVHFREPGLMHKAEISTESAAAVKGGVTSYMEMPNTIPPATTVELLEEKYARANKRSFANYSFYMGASNDNLEEVLKVDYSKVCGIKVFMGSSTGNMLVDNTLTLENLFRNAPVLIATHCEDEQTIRSNKQMFRERYGDHLTAGHHPQIRSREACYQSSSTAVALARKFNSRLHILHISTMEEIDLFDHDLALEQKRITAEACVHHMYFDNDSYETLGNLMVCNPAIKTKEDSMAIAEALKTGKIDVVATDHAPHTREEKEQEYSKAPAGLPLIQHSISMMITMGQRFQWDLPFIVQKMAHNPAICFNVKERGFLREGYFADLVLLDPTERFMVRNSELEYKCRWSPLNNFELWGKIKRTFVSGSCVFDGSKLSVHSNAQRLEFNLR